MSVSMMPIYDTYDAFFNYYSSPWILLMFLFSRNTYFRLSIRHCFCKTVGRNNLRNGIILYISREDLDVFLTDTSRTSTLQSPYANYREWD